MEHPGRISGQTTPGYADLGRMVMTGRRISDGFRKQKHGKYGCNQTSVDNPFNPECKRGHYRPQQPKTSTKMDLALTTGLNNPLFGGSHTLSEARVKVPPVPSIQLLRQYDMKHLLPSDRNTPCRKRYVRDSSISLYHVYQPLSESKQECQSAGLMKNLLGYKFASHSCQTVSPKVTQSTLRIQK